MQVTLDSGTFPLFVHQSVSKGIVSYAGYTRPVCNPDEV